MEELLEMTEEQYEESLTLYECGLRSVRAQVENAVEILKSIGQPISVQIESRIKEYGSVMRKCANKKKIAPTLENMKKNIFDIAGLRIITPFTSDVYTIRDAIMSQPGIEVLEEKDYIKEPKKSGYHSLHLIVSVQMPYKGITKSVPVEIQLRTLTMHVWATIEHELQYRNKDSSEEMAEMFAKTSSFLTNFDHEAEEIRNALRAKVSSTV